MFLNKVCVLCSKTALKPLITLRNVEIRTLARLATKKIPNEARILISCKRPEYNHHSNETHEKFDEVVLASKGWNHGKAKNDYFIVHPNPDAHNEAPRIPVTETRLHPELIKCLHMQGITELTSFQNEAISTIYKDKHTILAAETGCGKTLAYLLPIIDKLSSGKAEKMNAPRALILLPNRELAYQIAAVAQPYAESVGLKVKVMVGGRTKKFMINPQFSEIDMLIGTPGAIGKLSTVGIFRLSNVLYTVLDEADTLIDDSFVERMTGIIKRVAQSQLTMVAATLPKKLPPILEPYEPNFAKVLSPMLHKPIANITQKFIKLLRSAKPAHLLEIVKNAKEPLLIFTGKNTTCNWVAMFLSDNGVECVKLNADTNYALRIEQWNRFISGAVKVVVATDVGSRGLDTTQVKHVINYDFSLYAADYLHRIGRTGRFGSPNCRVTNFISGPGEVELVQKIEMSIRKNEPIPNVDGNITKILQNKILRKMREDGLM